MDFDPQHPFPVTEAMLGSEPLNHVPSREFGSPRSRNPQPDLKKQLALKE